MNFFMHSFRWIKHNRAQTRANTLILYAWNETSEGGWLVPTHAEGAARLEALKRTLR